VAQSDLEDRAVQRRSNILLRLIIVAQRSDLLSYITEDGGRSPSATIDSQTSLSNMHGMRTYTFTQESVQTDAPRSLQPLVAGTEGNSPSAV